jgi:hypothetical protein
MRKLPHRLNFLLKCWACHHLIFHSQIRTELLSNTMLMELKLGNEKVRIHSECSLLLRLTILALRRVTSFSR